MCFLPVDTQLLQDCWLKRQAILSPLSCFYIFLTIYLGIFVWIYLWVFLFCCIDLCVYFFTNPTLSFTVAIEYLLKSYSSGGQKSEIKLSLGPCFLCINLYQNPSLPLPSFWWIAVSLWHFLTSTYVIPVSAFVMIWCSLCVSVSSHVFIRTRVILGKEPTLLQCNFILTNYICSDPNSK